MKEQKQDEILKVKEYFGIVVEIMSEDNARTQREIVDQIFKTQGVSRIIYQCRRADKIIVVPEKELERMGIKLRR